MPKYSIIVGVYNQAATLPALFSSLRKQDFMDYEVHFCDDGSDDNSGDLIREFMLDPVLERFGIEVFYHRQEHKGMRLAKNLNQGIKEAKGEYCFFVMGDSMLEMDYLKVLNEYVAADRLVCGIRVQLDTIAGQLEGVDIDWRVKKNVIPEFSTVVISMPWLCLTGNGLTIPTAGLRELGGWCEEIEDYGGDDNEIVARFFFKGYMCWSVPELRLYHHWHKSRESNALNNELVAGKILQYEH